MLSKRKLDAAALERAALDYLAHYASSSENLRRVLLRRLKRRGDAGEGGDGARLVAALVERYLAAGLLDDAVYAAQQVASLRRRGASAHAIRQRLAEKGVAPEQIDAALGGDAALSELAAAAALVRRRRLGPFRPAQARQAAMVRDLAVLARAGFALDLARRVLGAADENALEVLVREEESLPGA